MKFLNVKRCLAVVVSAVILFTSLIGTGPWVNAESGDINNPPTTYPENCVKQFNADLDFNGSFFGNLAYGTRTSYPLTDLTKYDSFELDVYVESTLEETRLRFYFIDSVFKGSLEGRGFGDATIKTNQWQHISISSWNTGYGMNGDPTDAQGYFVESLIGEHTRLLVRNVCVTASDIVSPDELPDEVIAKLKGTVNTTVTEETVATDLTAKFIATDFSYGDNIELDYYIGSENSFETVDYVLVDENGKKAIYNLVSDTNSWKHLALTTGDFTADEGFDITAVASVALENTVVGTRYYFDNLCITGLAWPTDFPEGTAEEIYKKFDYMGKPGKDSLTAYGKTVDFTAHDFFEFDIYIESTDATENVYFFLYDNTYNPETTTALPTAAQRRQDNYTDIATNQWVHIRMVTSDLGGKAGTGDLSSIAGFYLTAIGMSNRYVIVNQCLTDLDIPEEKYNYTVIGVADKELDFKGKAESTEKVTFDSTLDLTAGKYFEFDTTVVTMESAINASIVFEDENGGTVSQNVNIIANTWGHKFLKISGFSGNADLSKIKSVFITGISAANRTVACNMAITDIIVPEASYKYTLDEEIPFGWDWEIKGDQTAVSYFNEDKSPIDLTAKEFIELDVCFETEIENPKVRMFFADTNGKLGFVDFKSEGNTPVNGWYHFSFVAGSFNSGYGYGGDPTNAIGFKLVWGDSQYWNNATIHVKNIAFTYFEKPELNTRYDVIYDTHISMKSANITGNNAYSTLTYFTEDKAIFDLTTGSHIELDVMVESENDTQKLRIYFLDATYKEANEGRGFINVTVPTNSWQHVLIEINEFELGYGMNGDPTKAVGMMIEGYAPDGTMYHFHNIVVTKKTEIPVVVGNKPSEPDKDSRYISNADNLMSALGIWNTSGMTTLSQYKTEGSASVGLTVRNQDDSKNTMRFLFDGTSDLSASESVRFDLFVDDLQLVKQNTVRIGFTSNKRFTDKNFSYYVEGKTLVLGWNSFEIPLKSFTGESGADWSKIYGFAVGLQNTNLGADDYFLLAIDNLRVYKTFVAAIDKEIDEDFFGEDEDFFGEDEDFFGEDEDFFGDDEDFFGDDEDFFGDGEEDSIGDLWADDDFTFDDILTIEPDTELKNETNNENASGTVKKIIRRRRVGNVGMTLDTIVLLVISIVGGVLLITGIIFAILTERKYRMLLKQTE